jgi:hypothetical protein
LVNATDAARLASEIETIIGDATIRALAAERGESLKRQLNPDAVAELFENVYLQALAGG